MSVIKDAKITKRDGRVVDFNPSKIENAIRKANGDVEAQHRISEEDIKSIVSNVVDVCLAHPEHISVEEIQDAVENEIMLHEYCEVARSYITYRYTHNLIRQKNTTDDSILSLVELSNQEAKDENSNKNPVISSTQRDYIAGEVSRDLTNRVLLPKEVVEAHKKGIIHFHDSDYYIQRVHNCDLINLEDMLQNGTVITGTMIEKPHSFSTACNVATQIIAQVASNQYGGQSISLTHLAPFVDISRQKIRKVVEAEMDLVKKSTGAVVNDDIIDSIVEERLRDEVRRGVQTIQYQVVTLLTTNGQAPFITVLMYLGETDDEQTKHDLAMIIEETLKQRMQGVKNESGVWVTPAFPKLIYILEEDNIHPESKYYYLTELAAKCTAKRMVPDYISEKKMLEYKGDVYTCMGCRSFLTPDRFTDAGIGNIAKAKNYVPGKHKYYGRLTPYIEPTLNCVNA